MPMVRMVPRAFTAMADAYLTPHIARYVDTFRAGFDEGLGRAQLSFMQVIRTTRALRCDVDIAGGFYLNFQEFWKGIDL